MKSWGQDFDRKGIKIIVYGKKKHNSGLSNFQENLHAKTQSNPLVSRLWYTWNTGFGWFTPNIVNFYTTRWIFFPPWKQAWLRADKFPCQHWHFLNHRLQWSVSGLEAWDLLGPGKRRALAGFISWSSIRSCCGDVKLMGRHFDVVTVQNYIPQEAPMYLAIVKCFLAALPARNMVKQ